MRNIETFAVIGGDLRSAYLAGLLAADGYKVITSGGDSTDLPPCVTGCTNPAQATTLADCVILPLPVTTDGSNINAPFSRMRITLDQVLNALAPHQSLVGGAGSDIVRREVESRGMAIHDYLQREELAIANSVPTAEGAIQLAMEELPRLGDVVEDMVARPEAWRNRIEEVRSRMIYHKGRGGEIAGAYLLDRMLAKQGDRAVEASGASRLDRAGVAGWIDEEVRHAG